MNIFWYSTPQLSNTPPKNIGFLNRISDWRVFLLFSLSLLTIRIWTLSGLPIYAIVYSGHDDKLMVDIAQNIGSLSIPYNEVTLVKGWMFPLFLSVLHKLRIPYITGIHLFNGLLATATSFALLPRKKQFTLFHYILTATLMFNPSFTSQSVLMRVYRNAFSALTAYSVIISMIALYLRRYEEKKKWIVWFILCCFSLPAFWYTREDSIWLLPFYLGVVIITTLSMLISKRRRVWIMLLCMILPLLSLEGVTRLTRLQRELYYGVPITNELSEGEFPRVMKAIYGVKMDSAQPQYVAASREKIRRLYKHSPTLASFSETLELKMDEWAQYGRLAENRDKHEVENGWFFWCLREAIAFEDGFSSLPKSQQIFGQIADEIEYALNSGALKKQPTMPSALMPPWTESTLERLADAILQIPDFVASFSGADQVISISPDYGETTRERFEQITNNRSIHSQDDLFYPAALAANATQKFFLSLYQFAWPYVSLLGRLCAIAVLALLIIRRTHVLSHREFIWTLVGLAGVLLVLYSGVGYNHAESCPSINMLYLSAAYPLVILFDLLAIHSLLLIILSINSKNCKKNSP